MARLAVYVIVAGIALFMYEPIRAPAVALGQRHVGSEFWAGWRDRVGLGPRLIYSGVGAGHRVTRNTEGGRLVALEDGSRWQIRLEHRVQALRWLVVPDVEVVDSGAEGAPHYELVDTATAERLPASYLGMTDSEGK